MPPVTVTLASPKIGNRPRLTDVNVERNEVPEFDPCATDSPDVDSDGEDRRVRNDYNIEKEAFYFVDESSVKHNLYLEIDDDEDGEETKRKVFDFSF
ncbi:hypothetical protein F2Q70_00004025 [Brassica cretica]|uniref:Uncharacterized protein n=1 Tax=Brassica cretica TaxID=69181 RepID=A0A8S9J3C9_BRACR|nr:hypothetical protein F2Q70_00004025 [Brassica cretica]